MLGIDFETACDVDIRKHGLDRYINHPSFRVLMAGTAAQTGGNLSFDFTEQPALVAASKEQEINRLLQLIDQQTLVAHNAQFERACLMWLGLDRAPAEIIDSAVIARTAGASSHLAQAAPQLTRTNKLEVGERLIKKFSIPRADGTYLIDHVDTWTTEDFDDWKLFHEYCRIDARAGLSIAGAWSSLQPTTARELAYEKVTQQMNEVGWTVDLDLVHQMQRVYEKNRDDALEMFRMRYDQKGELNFRSPLQLQKFCKARGVKVTSLDEQHVAKYLKQVTAKIKSPHTDASKIDDLLQVREMLRTKQVLGGSSLSKLQKIVDLTGHDGVLRYQYVHAGAGQTMRTSGKGVQMQNLKRLGPVPDNVAELYTRSHEWDNDRLARNLRQVFTSSNIGGRLIVGDFSAVESRGLAYLAGEQWKLDAYKRGEDVYKRLAESMLGIPYAQVTKAERSQGKVGELSCGYGAGPGAVSTFAEKMGMDLDQEEAGQIVTDWREANGQIVSFWSLLDQGLKDVAMRRTPSVTHPLPHDSLMLVIQRIDPPGALLACRPDAISVMLSIRNTRDPQKILMSRVFQGVYTIGKDVFYMKPNPGKTGKPWKEKWYENGRSGRYKLYGGKLAGILTQSFCRELFFATLLHTTNLFRNAPNVKIVGQFHDEIVLDWVPSHQAGAISLEHAVQDLTQVMSTATLGVQPLRTFPMTAEVNCEYRYTK